MPLYRRVVFNVLISNVDDHLRNHGFLWLGKPGWSLSPAYDLNPVPTDLKARVLTTNIDLDEGTCSLDLLEAASEYFALTLSQARAIIKQVATVTATWRDTAKAVGARSAEINRMASAFEHDDLKRALALWTTDKAVFAMDAFVRHGASNHDRPVACVYRPATAGAQGIPLTCLRLPLPTFPSCCNSVWGSWTVRARSPRARNDFFTNASR